jgi:hypothetical protein
MPAFQYWFVDRELCESAAVVQGLDVDEVVQIALAPHPEVAHFEMLLAPVEVRDFVHWRRCHRQIEEEATLDRQHPTDIGVVI